MSQSWERILKSATWSLDFPPRPRLSLRPAGRLPAAHSGLAPGQLSGLWCSGVNSPRDPESWAAPHIHCLSYSFEPCAQHLLPTLIKGAKFGSSWGREPVFRLPRGPAKPADSFLRYQVEAFLILGRPLVFPKLLHSRTSRRNSSDAFRTLETKTESAASGWP